MNESDSLDGEDRRAWILRRLDSDGSVRITPLAKDLGVSEMTIRRDLADLDKKGLARRVRGGAVTAGPIAFEDRHRRRAAAKARIAEKLLPLVPSTGAVAFDASSTLLRLATALDGARDLAVVTNGVETFQALQHKMGIRPLLTAGELAQTGSLVGSAACRSTGNFMFARLFISAAAIDTRRGSSEATTEEADVKRAFAEMSTEVIMAVDGSKLDTRDAAPAIAWSRVAKMVTDLDPGDSRLDPYRELVTLV